MKKHRNFLIFYCLWLAAIFSMLAFFDTPKDDKLPITNYDAVCETTLSDRKNHETKKTQRTWCCESMQQQPTTRLQ